MARSKSKTNPLLPIIELAVLAPEILMRGSPDITGSVYERPDSFDQDVVVFTPQISGTLRVLLFISKEDQAKTRRGKGWKATVTDVDTGIFFVVRSHPCGLGCHCAARVVWVGEKIT